MIQTSLVFGKIAEELIGLPIQILLLQTISDQHEREAFFPQALQNLIGIAKIFQIIIARQELNVANLTLKVTEIFPNDELTEYSESSIMPITEVSQASLVFTPINTESIHESSSKRLKIR
ncbi:uncharacterized protein LOC126655168 [Mercurialis annua]|uniref:uncharacterized protein LOC126655168 n=1 Tax=Mercurialis annua TaxID=3986 RepID=UPI0024AE3C7B|nr:uncharacterized protein LOC126655168 [Mercurialis annua]XP_055959661.1 uncharacterized protein LOC126655168 [Mercurialis annua]